MDYKVSVKKQSCLECGKELSYGRTDRKFCCDECKNKYHNRKSRSLRITHLRILGALNKNYEILDRLFKAGINCIDLIDIATMGFKQEYSTSYSKIGSRHLYRCFEYKYVITATRICNIEKIMIIDNETSK